MDRKPNQMHENLILTKIKQPYHTVLTFSYIAIKNTNMPYDCPAGS